MLAMNYWPKASLCNDPLVYHPHAYRYQASEQQEFTHWLPSFSPSGYEIYFDGLAHALALIADLGDNEQRLRAEAYVQSLEQQIGIALLPAFSPVIRPDDPGWASLQFNHLYGQLKNQPYTYHNGGLSTFLTSLYTIDIASHNQFAPARILLSAINSATAQRSHGG